MANLIITVVAIALVAVASLMGAYYGGQAVTEGRDQTIAATILTQGQQLAAAFRMAEAQGENLNAQDSLYTENYVSQPHAPELDGNLPAWTFVDTGTDVTTAQNVGDANGAVLSYGTQNTEKACESFNETSSLSNTTLDADDNGEVTFAEATLTDAAAVATALDAGGAAENVQAACLSDGTNTYFFYRL